MKTLRFFVFAFALAVLSFGVTACDDKGDDAPGINEKNLVGTWQIERRTGYVKYADYPDLNGVWDDDVAAACGYFILSENHTNTGTSYNPLSGDQTVVTGKWSLSGRTLLTSFPEISEVANPVNEATIRSLDKNVLTLESSGKLTDNYGAFEFKEVRMARKILAD